VQKDGHNPLLNHGASLFLFLVPSSTSGIEESREDEEEDENEEDSIRNAPGAFPVEPRVCDWYRTPLLEEIEYERLVPVTRPLMMNRAFQLRSPKGFFRAGICLALLQGAMFGDVASIRAANRIIAWGDVNYDVVASNSTSGPHGPPVAQISAGNFHSVALSGEGNVLIWGDNRFGQTTMPGILQNCRTAEIAAGNVHTLALTHEGAVVGWGPGLGEPGDYGQCAVPSHLGPVSAIAAGAVHSLALTSSGTVCAWGLNMNGQCDVPAGLSNVVSIAGGMYHSLALRADGTVAAWGDNRQGQTNVPEGLHGVIAIAAGGYHNVALRNDGTVVTWGTYGLAQMGIPTNLSNVVAIATGDYHSLALKRDGRVVVWGFNTVGQCNPPAGLANVVAVAARGGHSMVLVYDNTLPPTAARGRQK
jgi:Regulator of chromosome condensation (RCC1) repeat